MNGETALDVIYKTEELVGLLDGEHIHETGREAHVSADLAVDADQALRANFLGLRVGEGVLETISQEDNGRQALAHLVRAWARLWREHTGQFVQHPVLRRIQTFQMFSSSTILFIIIFFVKDN